jgi:KUP system potassium uptake protein
MPNGPSVEQSSHQSEPHAHAHDHHDHNHDAHGHGHGHGSLASLTLGSIGVVYGDIGTSPLYAMKECLAQLAPGERAEGVLGILSLMTWALLLVVCLKYIGFVMRADNRGEGGIFALLALSHS